MSRVNELSDRVFQKYRALIYDKVGINLADHKKTLVQSRLRKWIVSLDLENYDALYEKIASDRSGQMLMLLVNAITTNVTSFFREENQWIYLKQHVNELFDFQKRRIRIWSAACSSGQEPYSIAMFLLENLPDALHWDIKILATDISEEILNQAIRGEYRQKDIQSMPKDLLRKYFDAYSDESGTHIYRIKPAIRDLVMFRHFNLVTGDFSLFGNPLDLIFCRNVMIYFDRPTQNTLLKNFSTLLKRSGRLFIGHSESIQLKDGTYTMVQPSIYKIN